MWNRTKEIIPPWGTCLFSKTQFPMYYTNAKGCHIISTDKKIYTDMASMGIGSCILGYADSDVDNAVITTIYKGTMCTLNCPEELELAEMLLEKHKWAGAVRYARTGGEAMSIAVRIARAFTNKDIVTFCGYHGWHDWYLSANLENSTNLNIHLLPDLKVAGVPKCLKGTAIPFEFNNIDQLREIVEKYNIGAIIIEPMRHEYPNPTFFKEVREIANKTNAVIIYDAITIGWRMKMPEVNPDIIVYAKAISNGYPMAAIIGKKEIMNALDDTFVSSTYWTERIGFTAAIATIKKLKKYNVIERLENLGILIQEGWKKLALKHSLDITILPPPCLVTFKFNYDNDKNKKLETIFKEEMLKRQYIAGLSVYVSFAHSEDIIEQYLKDVDEVFKTLKEVAKK